MGWTELFRRTPPPPPIDFVLPDQDELDFVYDAAFRAQHSSVLVWYRGHW